MNSMVYELIRKDWRLNRVAVATGVILGILALALVQLGGEVPFVVGAVCFYTVLGVLASLLPQNIYNEQKNQTRAFVMSLPVSPVQYTIAKLISTVGVFLLAWLTLVGVASSVIAGREQIPNGMIPFMVVLAAMVLVGFTLICAVGMVAEKEGYAIATMIGCNLFYSLGWYFLIRLPEVNQYLGGPNVVWSPFLVTVIAVEFLLITLVLALTLYLQTRKQNVI